MISQAHATAYEDRLLKRQPPRFTSNGQRELQKFGDQVITCNHALADALWHTVLAPPAQERPSSGNAEEALKKMDEACKASCP